MKKPYSIRGEISNLKKQIDRTDDRMDELAAWFWKNGGSCCPDCGVPEYSLLSEKQDRRYQRIKYLENKLIRDTQNERS